MWFFAEIGIRRLVDKSLVAISEEKLKMHDLLQQMGMDIVCEENKEPRKRSRLWNAKDICDMLTRDKVRKCIDFFHI